MKLRQLWVGLVVTVMLGLTIGVSQAQEKSYRADRFDVAITVEEGGSVLVTETVVFDFAGGPFTFVFRELPLDHTDGISVLEAAVDGVSYPAGENPGQVEIGSGDPMRITWHFEPTSNATRTFVLTYRVDGVVRQESGSDALYWQALPDSYEYSIGQSETVVDYLSSTSLVGSPEVLAGTAVTSQSDNQVTFTATNLAPDSPLVVMLPFAEGSLITSPPNWQVEQAANAARRAELNAQIPYWIGFAVLIFAVGLVGLIAYWRRNKTASLKTKATVMEAPLKHPAGMAGALTESSPSPQWANAQGTMFSLAEKGILIIEELPEKKWYRKFDFVVKQVEHASDLKPHEAGFLNMLYDDKNGRVSSIKLSDMGKKISGSSWKKYKEPLTEEIEHAGFLSESHKKARMTLMALGAIFLFLGVAIALGAAILSDTVGLGPLAIGVAIAVLGFVSLIMGETISPLSDEGIETAVSWKQYKNYLEAVSKGKQAIDSPTMFEKHLPYVAAFGLLHQWAKQFEKEGWTTMPAYFQVLPNTTSTQAMGAFVAMTAAANASGGSAAGAGAAGAGAAGGGASGAG